jgi:tRNA A37 threonylcarbamoyladenosine biosynthesis protein TsaE
MLFYQPQTRRLMSMTLNSFISKSPFRAPDAADTRRIGSILGSFSCFGDVVFLRGNLGVGKTEFAKGFVRGALSKQSFDPERQWKMVELAQQGVAPVSDDEEFEENDDEEAVLSPTFSLCNVYEGSHGSAVYHLDLYRIKTEQELDSLRLDSVFRDNISLVEWPERLTDKFVPSKWIDVDIQHVVQENEEFRLIHIQQKIKL